MKFVEPISKVADLGQLTLTAIGDEDQLQQRHSKEDKADFELTAIGDFYFAGDGRTDIGDLTDGDDSHDGDPGGWKASDVDVFGSKGDDDIDHFEVGFAQTFYGFAGDDEITAGYNDDVVFGGIGNDNIYLNAGDDIGIGDDGDDFILGQDGNDEIHTGDGADQVIGGADNDTIFLVDDGDVDTIYFTQGDGQDVVDNFELGCDQISLGAPFGLTEFAEIEALISYSGDQALLDLGGGDSIVFTQLDGMLTAEDFGF